MSASDMSAAIARWRQTVGAVDVKEPSSAPFRDLAENMPRRIPAVLYPQTVREIQDIVATANETGVAVYPVSTGKNWGIGSHAPVHDDCVVVDLSRMNRIRSLDLQHGLAVIEPGVSQAQIADRLTGTAFMLNVTTSCRDSSILGNALERGEGAFRSRVEDLLALEIVLGNGTMHTTSGAGPLESKPYYGKHTGPDLVALFCQSNFGIAIAGLIALVPRPERIDYMHAVFDQKGLIEVTDAILQLHRHRVLNATIRLSHIAMEPGKTMSEFDLLGPVMGRAQMVESAEAVIRSEFSRLSSFKSIEFGGVDGISPKNPLYDRAVFFNGTASCDLLRSRFHVQTCDLDGTSALGWSLLASVVPLNGISVSQALDAVRKAADSFGLVARVEVSIISGRSINLLTATWFKRSSEDETERARKMYSAMRLDMMSLGFLPQRDNIDAQKAQASGVASAAAALKQIKTAFDPKGIIAPGRYI